MPDRICSVRCFGTLTIALSLLASACGSSQTNATNPDDAAAGAGGVEAAGGAGGDSSAADCTTPSETSPGTVKTDRGAVRGVDSGDSWAFLGIPYAAPPVGDLRFRPPVDPACAEEIVADHFPPQCTQWDSSGELVGQEDCLYLNVWTPKNASSGSPVMFFVHGGGFQQGSSAEMQAGVRLYDGEALAEATGNVVVTINYRLGPFGYLGHESLRDDSGSFGNFGTQDQIFALKWVQRNIAAFGGDPARVLLFGESAGAVAVCTLLTSPLTSGLFSRALMQSGACRATSAEHAKGTADDVVAALGCDAADVGACLRAASPESLMQSVPKKIDLAATKPLPYRPVVDGVVVTDDPLAVITRGQHQHVPVIIGSNTGETAGFVGPIADETAYEAAVRAYVGTVGGEALTQAVLQMYPVSDYASPRLAFIALTSDARFVCSARAAATALVKSQEESVHRYVFGHVADGSLPPQKASGAAHGSELLYLFDHLDVRTAAGVYHPTAGDRAVARTLQRYWSEFAATGQPEAEELPVWPEYELSTEPSQHLDEPVTTETKHRNRQCDFWSSLGPAND